MVKNIFKLILAIAIMALSKNVFAWGDNSYNAGVQTVTAVTNSTTASSWYILNGSNQPQYDPKGNKVYARAFQFYDENNTCDILYSFSGTTTPTAWGVWKAVWGPYQNNMQPPPTGIAVCLTFTTSNSINIRFESKQ
jgi:hypothetical protein